MLSRSDEIEVYAKGKTMALPKLNEIIAVATGKKGKVQKVVTEVYHKIQKEALFDGLTKTYAPRTEDGDKLPPESKQPQLRVKDMIDSASKAWKDLFDIVLTLDHGNCKARGDIEVQADGGTATTILADVPAVTLLFLEKQLVDIKTFVGKLPTPDAAEQWSYNAQTDCLVTAPSKTARTKKVQKPIVLFPATTEHPAQTQLITEDVIAGDWTQTLYTTRMDAKEKNAILGRIDLLLDDVKVARERANWTQVEKKKCGEVVLNYIFGGEVKAVKS